MKKKLISFIILLFEGSSCLTTKVVSSNELNRKNDLTIYNGAAFTGISKKEGVFEYHYKDGLRDGMQKEWYSNGQLKYEYFFKEGDYHGSLKKWNDKGTLIKTSEFKNGNTWGTVKEWYENGNPMKWNSFHNTEEMKTYFHGPFKYWDSTGTLREEYTMIENKMHGVHTKYYEDGHIELRSHYSSGKLDGDYRTFHPDGTPKVEAVFSNGEKTDDYKEFHPNGELWKIRKTKVDSMYYYYDNGKLNGFGRIDENGQQGVWEWYYETGAEIVNLEYKNGTPVGKATFYEKDGSVGRKVKFVDGKEVPLEE